jgi:hypothetical protein
LFGLPTSSSQAILYEMIVQKSFLLGPVSFDQFIGVMLPTVAIASVSGFLIAGPLSSVISNIFARCYQYINYLLMAFLLFLMFWFAHIELSVWMYMIVFSLSTVFGLYFKGYNLLKIVYFYIIADFVFENIIKFGYMHGIL